MCRKIWNEARWKFSRLNLCRRRKFLAVAVTDEMVVPGDELSRTVDAALKKVKASRAVIIVGHIVFAGPKQLYGHAYCFCDPGYFHHVIVIEPASERSAR